MANVNFLVGSKTNYEALESKDSYSFYLVDDNGAKELYLGTQKLTSQDELEAAITRLDNDENTSNSIRNVVKSYIDALDTSNDVTIASVSNDVVTLKAGVKQVDGVIAQGTGTDIVLSEIAVTGDAEDVAYDNTTSQLTATDVQAAIDEVASAAAGGVDSKTIYLDDSESTSGTSYAKIYKIYQGSDDTTMTNNDLIGTINIPKDMVVSAGEVKTVATADTPYTGAVVGDKYIELTIANNDGTKLYIPVKDLTDVYTGSTGAEATVTVGNDNSISVGINKVNATKIVYREAQAAQGESGDPDYVPAVAEQTVKAKIDAIDSTIAAMDADLDASGTAQHSGTFVVSGVTQVDGVITAVDSVEVEAAGAAAAVVGTGTGRTGSGTELDPYVYADTIKGVKTMIDDVAATAAAGVDALDATEFALAEKDNSTNVVTIHGISETDGIVAVGVNSGNDVVLAAVAGSGAAADVSIADAGSYTSETNVEGAIQELYGKLTWVSF